MDGCSLDLRLSPVTSTLQSCRRHPTVSDESSARRSKETNALDRGILDEYDLVEFQIRAIIEMASKKWDVTALELAPARLGSHLGFSVKRSLKRFLEKRKKKKKCKFVAPHHSHSYTYTSSSTSSSHYFYH